MIASTTSNQDQGRKYIKLQPRMTKHHRFQFPSHELAFQVRQVVYLKLIQFDKNNDQQFQQQEIKQFLETVLGEDGPQVHYFVKNVFRYDYNNDGRIEYDELVNFCMEQHFGEIAIQRLHRKKIYHKGQQRIMNLPQFIQTVKYALSFVNFIPKDNDIRIAFEVVDLDKDGFITYQDYFRFLKQYFGSKSMAAKMVHKEAVIEQIKEFGDQLQGLNIIKKYSKIQEKRNSPQRNNKNVLNKGDKPLVIQPNPQQPPQPGSNSARQSIRGSIANNDKKPKPLNNSKIQITLLNKSDKKQSKAQIFLNQRQLIICQRIVRLVLSQLKLTLIACDNRQKCILSADNIFTCMRNIFGYGQFLQSQMYKRGTLSREKQYSYEQATKIIITQHIYNVFRPLQSQKNLSQRQFVGICKNICGLVKNTPLLQKYQHLYAARSQKTGTITTNECQQLFIHIFNNCWKQ